MIYWITGQPGAGKTTLARAIKRSLEARGCSVVHIDADEWRKLGKNQDFSEEGRRKNVRSAQEFAEEKSAEGKIVVCSFVSPYRDQREDLKSRSKVVEIFVHTDEIRGRENFHVKDYQRPNESFVDINTGKLSVEQAVAMLLGPDYEI